MKHIFLDTNIFLHFKAFNDIPWETIVNDDNYTIVIAPIITNELDKHKNSSNNKLANKAKSTIDKFRRMRSGTLSVNFPFHFINRQPSENTLTDNRLTSFHQDDLLIASIIEYPLENTDEKILITGDFSLELRSEAFGIKCIQIPDEYKLAPEMDETEKKLKETEKALAEFKTREPKPTLCFVDGTNKLEHIFRKMQFEKAEYLRREMEKVRRNYSYMKKSTEEDPFRNLITMATGFRQISDSQMDDHNSELDKFYIKSGFYLEKEYDYKLYLMTCLEIEFFMNNTGSSPADDIDIHLHFPEGLELVKKLKDGPKEPDAPQRPRSFIDMAMMGSKSKVADELHHRFAVKQEDPETPRLAKLKPEDGYAEFKLKTLKHSGKNVSLGKVYVCFKNVESMNSFHIDYKLAIRNLAKNIDGKLHVVIDKTQILN